MFKQYISVSNTKIDDSANTVWRS